MDQTQQPALRWKQEAGQLAATYITDGMIVGLGTGSTATEAIKAIGMRVRAGLRITAVSTSDRSSALAGQLGIPLVELDSVLSIDVTIDGADEIDPASFILIKGLGGALLREKLIALATKMEIIVADDSKLVRTLGAHAPVPVEVEMFGWRHTQTRLEQLGCRPVLRPGTPGADARTAPYITDNGHYILDCHFGLIQDPVGLAHAIKSLSGVVEHGLFIGLAHRLVIAGPGGIRVWDRPAPLDNLPLPQA
jgi:ribose 5-phosphate isomerase A